MGLLRVARNVSYVLWGTSGVLVLTAIAMVFNTHGTSGVLDLAGTFLAVFFLTLALLFSLIAGALFALQRAVRARLPRGDQIG